VIRIVGIAAVAVASLIGGFLFVHHKQNSSQAIR